MEISVISREGLWMPQNVLGLFIMRCYHGIGYNTDGFFFLFFLLFIFVGAHASQNNNYYEQWDLDSHVSGKMRIE